MSSVLDFRHVKAAVAAQFQRMQQAGPGNMFRADIDKDQLWSLYLGSFPEGTNPVYRERTEHDCSCCRQFVRAVGDAVALVDGELASVWSARVPAEPAYETVCQKMAEAVLSRPISGPFVHYEGSAGVDRTFEFDNPEAVTTWTHFHANLDRRLVKPKDQISTYLSERRSQYDVFLRSLREITGEAIDTVLELVAQGSLYRGEEHRQAVELFKRVKSVFEALTTARDQEIFAWTADVPGSVSRIRNTAIGTLLVDLSSGRDLEESVRSFEAKVAPTSYKRPSSLITPAMVAKAKATIEELGLSSALDRRYARITDVSVDNVLFADRAARRAMTGDVFDELAHSAAASGSASKLNLDKVEAVPIDRFIGEILPRAESIDVLFENRHAGNLVSLIAPVDPTARPLFKWPNNFSWSYAGELADSIRERVKQAGGNVTGDLCCRLAWFNYDDLDLHLVEPTGCEIYFGKRVSSDTRGMLDVDMNVTPTTKEPVENIVYADRSRMREGSYELHVHQYRSRGATDPGFEVEIQYLGTVRRYAYPQAVRQSQKVTVAKFHYSQTSGLDIIDALPESQASRQLWGLGTGSFRRVSSVMLSPNCWSGRCVGNKHYIFTLDGCRNDGTARGFFNEFLSAELDPHRKVFEVVGSRMKPADSDEQLSGLGFSSTQRNELVCRVRGSFTRTIKVTF